MPRQGDGTYVPPSGVGEIVAGATADAEDVRGGLLDLGNEITNSLAVDGQSAMSGQLTLATGSSSGAPALNFSDATTSGLHTNVNDKVGIVATGTEIALFGDDFIDFYVDTVLRGGSNNVLGDIYVRDDGDTVNTVAIDNNSGNITTLGVVTASDFHVGGVTAVFPSGTRMTFQQTSAPLGWVKETNASYNDCFMQMVTGSAGAPSGSKTVSGFIIDGGEMPSHTHEPGSLAFNTTVAGDHSHTYESRNVFLNNVQVGGATTEVWWKVKGTPNSTSVNGAHFHGTALWSGTTGGAGSGNNLNIKRTPFIIAQKS